MALLKRETWSGPRQASLYENVQKTAEKDQVLGSVYYLLAEATNCGQKFAIIQQELSEEVRKDLKAKNILCEEMKGCAIPGRIWKVYWK